MGVHRFLAAPEKKLRHCLPEASSRRIGHMFTGLRVSTRFVTT